MNVLIANCFDLGSLKLVVYTFKSIEFMGESWFLNLTLPYYLCGVSPILFKFKREPGPNPMTIQVV